MPRTPRTPSYRPHSSGQARVTIDGKDYLLGPHGSPESHVEYKRVLAEWASGTGRFAPQARQEEELPLTVAEVLSRYWDHAQGYYGFDHTRGDRYCLQAALGIVRERFGSLVARDFGPKALKACREDMIGQDWSRNYVNAQVDRVRRAFRWAVEEELVPAQVHQGLLAVAGLRAGKSAARETKRVKPVPPDVVNATLPHLQPVVRAMVEIQLLTGARPAEVCRLRHADLDKGNPACWVYRPEHHKTEHHDKERLVLIGPRAQAVLTPFLAGPPEAPCFSPAHTREEQNRERREARKTPLWPSHLDAQARKRKAHPRRAPQDRYDVPAYRRAIARACDLAFPLPEQLGRRAKANGKPETKAEWWGRLSEDQRREVKAWQKANRWHPNRLRHLRATELRPHGLDVVKTVLGHSKVETTQIYAEKDLAAAMELVAKVG